MCKAEGKSKVQKVQKSARRSHKVQEEKQARYGRPRKDKAKYVCGGHEDKEGPWLGVEEEE
jgi:hypothetical protein